MQTRPIGSTTVSEIGLGAMPMSIEGRPDEARSIATIHAALEAGITLIDTADAYHVEGSETGHNERLVAKALSSYGADTDSVVVATKGGHVRPGDGSWQQDAGPDHLRSACEASLRALGVDAIGLYQLHRPDPDVHYADSLGAMRELYDAGKVRMVGISNATLDQIEQARQVVGEALVSVQNQFSPRFRSSADELRYCGEHGLAFLPWSPLGGIGKAAELGSSYAPFAELAEDRGVSPQQVCLAWLLAQGRHVVPIPGSSRPETVTDSARAGELRLTEEELSRLDAA